MEHSLFIFWVVEDLRHKNIITVASMILLNWCAIIITGNNLIVKWLVANDLRELFIKVFNKQNYCWAFSRTLFGFIDKQVNKHRFKVSCGRWSLDPECQSLQKYFSDLIFSIKTISRYTTTCRPSFPCKFFQSYTYPIHQQLLGTFRLNLLNEKFSSLRIIVIAVMAIPYIMKIHKFCLTTSCWESTILLD